MMRLLRILVLALAALPLAGAACLAQPGVKPAPAAVRARPAATPTPVIAILCYHDVSNDPKPRLETVSPEFLRAQIRDCKASGWSFMSLSELLARRGRRESLPPRVMVLTFDDGYRSFMDHVLPILREEGVRATLAVITSFVDRPVSDMPPLMTWAQIREAEQTGYVEIAAHSHDLHRYETDNPYRDTAPSAGTRRYLLKEARYENRDEYRGRIGDDLRESQRLLSEKLGHPVPVLVWPYGQHTSMARAIAAEAGFATTLALGWREVRPEDLRDGCLPRIMVTRNLQFSGREPRWLRAPRGTMRAAQVDLDDLYDPNPEVFRRKVEQMVGRVRSAGATHVLLQACPDPRGDGMLRQAWFMNHQAPVRADAWSMVAHKLAQARLKVWVRAPSMNLSWVWEQHPEWRIPCREGRTPGERKPWYYRLSPNLPEVRRAAIDFYSDMAVYLPIDGVLFDDDAFMLKEESLNGSLASGPAAKAEAIDGMLDDIRAAVRAWRPGCEFGRNLYAPVVERNGLHPGFSQDFARCLRDYDMTVVMAYSRMEGHQKDAQRWIASLARKAQQRWKPVSGRKGEPAPFLIKLQAYDWNTEQWIPGKELQALAYEARRAGATHLGVYPVSADQGEIPDRLLEGLSPDSIAAREPAQK